MITNATLESMNRSTVHGLSPQVNHEDRARQAFVMQIKRGLNSLASTGLEELCARNGVEEPEQAAAVLEESSFYAAWNALTKGSQRQMWRALSDMIGRQEDGLEEIAQEIDSRPKLGSLWLDPDLEIPEYLRNTAYHGQPGGYVLTRYPEDLYAGLMQEAGGTLYTRGAGTGRNDSKAQAVVRYIRGRFPELAPKRILDMGCGYGAQTCGYALAFPEAETHGADLGAAVLRFGHLRAESLSVALHLHQMDGAATRFPDGHFDLIVSNIVLHEAPADKIQAMMNECRRLLAPGGLVLHQDAPSQRPDMSVVESFLSMWQLDHNDEPFWGVSAGRPVPSALIKAGFEAGSVYEDWVPQIDGPLYWYFVGARS